MALNAEKASKNSELHQLQRDIESLNHDNSKLEEETLESAHRGKTIRMSPLY